MALTHYLISYDISDPQRLQKIAKIMEDFGTRVLYSVFECFLTPIQLKSLRKSVESLVDPLEDSVRYYVICEKCERFIEHIGRDKQILKYKDTDIL